MGHRYVLLAFVLCGPLSVTDASFLPISDAFYPYVGLQDCTKPITWNTKLYSLAMAQSEAIRINSRGVQFIPPVSSQLIFKEAIGTGSSLVSVPPSALLRPHLVQVFGHWQVEALTRAHALP